MKLIGKQQQNIKELSHYYSQEQLQLLALQLLKGLKFDYFAELNTRLNLLLNYY